MQERLNYMKKGNLLTVSTICTAILFGCGSVEPSVNTAVSTSENSLESEIQSGQTFEDDFFKTPDFAVSQVPEYPIEIPGKCWYFQEKPENFDVFTLFMLDYEVDEITENSIVAHGILTNEIVCTDEEITVTYSMTKSEEGTYFITGYIVPEEYVMMAPAIPFDVDLLYGYEVNVFEQEVNPTGDPIAVLKNYTIELTTEGWQDKFMYNDYIYFIDSEGNRYQTYNKMFFYFSGTEWEDFHWTFSYEFSDFSVKLIDN